MQVLQGSIPALLPHRKHSPHGTHCRVPGRSSGRRSLGSAPAAPFACPLEARPTFSCTIRNIDSAASRVCATCRVRVPGLLIVRRKNLPATQVVMPICRAFSTIFCLPRRSSNLRCAAFATKAFTHPSRSRDAQPVRRSSYHQGGFAFHLTRYLPKALCLLHVSSPPQRHPPLRFAQHGGLAPRSCPQLRRFQ